MGITYICRLLRDDFIICHRHAWHYFTIDGTIKVDVAYVARHEE